MCWGYMFLKFFVHLNTPDDKNVAFAGTALCGLYGVLNLIFGKKLFDIFRGVEPKTSDFLFKDVNANLQQCDTCNKACIYCQPASAR